MTPMLIIKMCVFNNINRVAPVGPPASGLPYPGCAAALKCVLEEYCNIEGVMVNTPVFYTEQQKIFRTPLMVCTNVLILFKMSRISS